MRITHQPPPPVPPSDSFYGPQLPNQSQRLAALNYDLIGSLAHTHQQMMASAPPPTQPVARVGNPTPQSFLASLQLIADLSKLYQMTWQQPLPDLTAQLSAVQTDIQNMGSSDPTGLMSYLSSSGSGILATLKASPFDISAFELAWYTPLGNGPPDVLGDILLSPNGVQWLQFALSNLTLGPNSPLSPSDQSKVMMDVFLINSSAMEAGMNPSLTGSIEANFWAAQPIPGHGTMAQDFAKEVLAYFWQQDSSGGSVNFAKFQADLTAFQKMMPNPTNLNPPCRNYAIAYNNLSGAISNLSATFPQDGNGNSSWPTSWPSATWLIQSDFGPAFNTLYQ